MSIWSRAITAVRKYTGGIFNRAPSGYADPRNFERVAPRSFAGVYVTPDIALQVSTVWACVDLISKDIAGSPFEVYERLEDGDRELLLKDQLVWLMNTRPNPDMTAIALREALTHQALLVGNGYAEIEFDIRGRVAAIWPLWYEEVQIARDFETGELVYEVCDSYRWGGTKRVLRSWQVFHLRGSSQCGWIGEGIAIRGANAISLAIAQERFAATYFGNGTNIGGTLSVAGKLEARQRIELRDEFEAAYRGAGKSHRPLVLEEGQTYTPFTPDANKAQLTEARQLSIQEIARWFAVPPHKIGDLSKSSFSNIEHLGIEFSRETLRPWAIRWEQEADYKLFSAIGKKFCIINLEWASQGDFKSRMDGYQIARRMGVFSVNDVLRMERKNTIGPEGDTRMVEMAMQLLERVGQALQPDPNADPQKDPEIDPPESDDQETDDPETDPSATALAFAVKQVFSMVYDRAAKRRYGFEQQVGGRDNEEGRAQFVAKQKTILRRELEKPAEMICKVFGYTESQEVLNRAMAVAGELFNVDSDCWNSPERCSDEWADSITKSYLR